jgi:ArsR family transcriptional regulator, virulence genes transcriptional regulator
MTGEELREHAEAASKLLLTIGNPVRLMVLCLLLDGETSVGELNSEIQLSQSALSQHLAVLKREGLVTSRREGLLNYYAIADHEVRAVMQCLYRIYCE